MWYGIVATVLFLAPTPPKGSLKGFRRAAGTAGGAEGVVITVARRVDAGKVELDGARYLDFSLPFTISQLVWIEAILVGGAEIYRNRELAPEKRIYPGTHACAPPPACTQACTDAIPACTGMSRMDMCAAVAVCW